MCRGLFQVTMWERLEPGRGGGGAGALWITARASAQVLALQIGVQGLRRGGNSATKIFAAIPVTGLYED